MSVSSGGTEHTFGVCSKLIHSIGTYYEKNIVHLRLTTKKVSENE